MQQLLEKVCIDFEATLVEFDGEADHVHMLIQYPPKVSISKLVNSLKGTSSRRLRVLHPDIQKYYWKGGLWSPSYFAGSCGGAPIDMVKQYIQNQETLSKCTLRGCAPYIPAINDGVLRRIRSKTTRKCATYRSNSPFNKTRLIS